jgi:uncharacterized protein (DUF433 family)
MRAKACLNSPRSAGYWLSMRRRIVSSTPDVMGGAQVFAGTRVPVQTLMNYIEEGDSIDDFLEGFPTVKREQVIGFLEEEKNRAMAVRPDWLAVLRACPISMDDMPSRRRELPQHRKL